MAICKFKDVDRSGVLLPQPGDLHRFDLADAAGFDSASEARVPAILLPVRCAAVVLFPVGMELSQP